MPAMLDLITLYREAQHEPTSEIDSSHDAPGLPRDYFDTLIAQNYSSFSYLTDFSSAFGILFHEMSRYIRYQKSYDRNRMILEYSSWLLFDQTADQIMRDFRNNTSELNDIVDIKLKMIQFFAEAYMEAVFPVFSRMYEIGRIDLMLLIQKIKNTYRLFIRRVSSLSELETSLDAFLNNTSYIVDPESAEIMKCLKTIRNSMLGENVFQTDSDEFQKLLEEASELLNAYSRKWDEKNKESSLKAGESSFLARLLQNIGEQINIEDVGIFTSERSAIQAFYRMFYEKLLDYLNKIWEEDRGHRFVLYLFPERNRMYKEEGLRRITKYVSSYIVNSIRRKLTPLSRK